MTGSGTVKRLGILVTALLVASACTPEDIGLYTNPCPQGDSFADRQEVKRLQEEDGVNCVRTEGNDGSSSKASESASPPTTSRKTQSESAVSSLAPKATVTSAASSSPSGSTYTFRQDDTLWSIAERFLGSGSRWPEIAELNGIGNPNEIPNGLVLLLPDSGSTSQDSASVASESDTSACGTKYVQELVEEIDLGAQELTASNQPSTPEQMPEWFGDQQDVARYLYSMVSRWGECLDSRSSRLSDYQSAYIEWVVSEAVWLEEAGSCYTTGSDWYGCLEDLLYTLGSCHQLSMEMMTKAFVEGGPALPWRQDAIFPYPAGFRPADCGF